MRTLITALLLMLAAGAMAETRYVDDRLVITMRSGQGNSYQILKTLPSGTRLELLENAGEYSRVRTAAGIEGWVLSQYLTATPIARDRLEQAGRELENIRQQKQQLQQQLAQAREEQQQLEAALSRTEAESKQLAEELQQLREVAARPVELAQENRRLQEQLNTLEATTEQLQSDNRQLADSSRKEWFVIGAGVLGSGILLGLLLPLLRRRKKSGMFD